MAGTRSVEYYAHHAPNGIVNDNKMCAKGGVNNHSAFDKAGIRTMEYRAQHIPNRVVNFE